MALYAEFSEALQEMGTCLLKRVITPNKNGINGNYVMSCFFLCEHAGFGN